jgi:predicted MFS family arabinose efflux permease
VQNKVTFYLAIATTLAFGTFGIVGALYSEFIKENWQMRGNLIAFDLLFALTMISATIYCFLEAWLQLEKEEEKNSVS